MARALTPSESQPPNVPRLHGRLPSLTSAALLHSLAGILLGLFAGSHLVMLARGDFSFQLTNVVFPFLTNGSVFLIGAALQLAVATLCLGWAGRDSVSIAILSLVALMLSYRWAFTFNGGTVCGCLGWLGKLLRVSADTERLVAGVALLALALTASPYCLRMLRLMICRPGSGAMLFGLILGAQGLSAAPVVEVCGTYETSRYNPKTRQPYTNTFLRAAFSVTWSGSFWTLSVTNLDRPSRWTRLTFDGTNTYHLNPYEGYFVEPGTNELFVAISPGPLYQPAVNDELVASLPWLAYGPLKDVLVPDRRGRVDLPLPWYAPRLAPKAFGYRWIASLDGAERFLASCDMVRDVGLDLPEAEELIRPGLDYVDTMEDRNRYRRSLQARKWNPDGFRVGRYECIDWHVTNGWRFPRVSRLRQFLPPGPKEDPEKWGPVFDGTLQANAFLFHPTGSSVVEPPVAAATVNDYRYTRRGPRRIFRYAEYRLGAGEAWRGDADPALLAAANEHLRNGPRYDAIGAPTLRNILSWLLLAAIPSLSASVMWRRRTNRTPKEETCRTDG